MEKEEMSQVKAEKPETHEPAKPAELPGHPKPTLPEHPKPAVEPSAEPPKAQVDEVETLPLVAGRDDPEFVGAGVEPEYGIPESARAQVAHTEIASRAPSDFEVDYAPPPFLANGQNADATTRELERDGARLRRSSGVYINDHVAARDRELLNGDQ